MDPPYFWYLGPCNAYLTTAFPTPESVVGYQRSPVP
jgi:hypothetical protein